MLKRSFGFSSIPTRFFTKFSTYCLLVCFTLMASHGFTQVSIWGHITNSYGEKLEGASVFVLGSNSHATITDFEGYYSLDSLSSTPQTLKVTYLGYSDVEVDLYPTSDTLVNIVLSGSIFQLDDIQIIANKLNEKAPFSFTDYQKEDIEFKNLGQDIPFLVEHTPSVVVTSDAGAGIGYTGLRVRGSDGTRINVTINGVPLNDSESHGVFWVNLPDFSSSVEGLQLQRGVGPSTNGAGAFGATMGLNTNYVHQNPFVKIEGSYGSFNTQRVNASFNTGLMNNKYLIEGRYSLINSDGFIDRASSELSSWFFSAAKVSDQKSLRFNVFSGKERTFQAWNGIPQVKVEGTEDELLEHYFNNSNGDYNTVADSINLFDSDPRRYNAYLYPNQVDDYRQTHAQMVWAKQVTDKFKFNTTLHYTRGLGFFEEFKYDEDLIDYGIIDDNLESSSIIRRRWLDNHFYGVILNAETKPNDKTTLTGGISFNSYLGDHYGEVIAAYTDTDTIRGVSGLRYYESDATKSDLSAFVKGSYDISPRLQVYGDLQVRNLTYSTQGVDNDGAAFDIDTSYNFFNPKVGLTYQMDDKQLYVSYARAHREPVRSDFLDAIGTAVPQAERLDDIELGIRGQNARYSYSANLFFMNYQNQLILTGEVNDVGGGVRTNVDNSYRLGLELSGLYRFSEALSWSPNVTLSNNKVKAFSQRVVNYDTGIDEFTDYENTDIAFSPSLIAGSNVGYSPLNGLTLNWLSKYVGKQYLDNTSSVDRSLSAYWVNDIMATYTIESEFVQEIKLKLLMNNIFNQKYSSNGYTYTYIYGTSITENYVYPQAGLNFLLGLSVTF